MAGTVNTFASATNGELCVVNFDLNSNGSISNDTSGPGLPGALTTVGSVAGNESTNLRVTCDTGFADLPPGDFLPPRDPFNQQDVFGAQIFKIAVSRDAHAASGVNAKLHLNDPQIETCSVSRRQLGVPPEPCRWRQHERQPERDGLHPPEPVRVAARPSATR